jgi:hypothetical protein
VNTFLKIETLITKHSEVLCNIPKFEKIQNCIHAFIPSFLAHKFLRLTYFYFESKLSLYVSNNRGFFFTKFKIGLNQFGVSLQNLQKKITKEKEKRNRKEEKKAAGDLSAWSQKRPTTQLLRTPNRYPPFSLSLSQ